MPPIDRLPSPILSDIFILTCHVASRQRHAHGRVPYVLAAVSRFWRMVALSTPMLWNFFDAVLSPECVSIHLERSGILPLDVSLDTSSAYKSGVFPGPLWRIDADAFKKSLDLLHDNWARIRHLDVSLITNKHEDLVVDTFNDAIKVCDNHSLRSIFVHASPYDENGRYSRPDTEMQLFLPHSDTLCRIELNGVDLCLTPRPYTCSLLGLRELDLCSQSTIYLSNTLFPMLELLPNLSYLSLCGHTLTDNWITPRRPERLISLPMLETLRLVEIGGQTHLNYLLQTLDIPRLRLLRCFNNPDMGEGLVVVMRQCKLEVLELIGPYCVRAVDAAFSNADSLGELKRLVALQDVEGPPSGFVESLARRLCKVAYFPMLEYLRVPCLRDQESVKAIDKLRSTRPSLEIEVESEPEYSDDASVSSHE
ncbi:hypothetical protein FRC08_018791 [Ceratobasidium sp. 394]|nr:hypothetical protein FRC08_018791 [Ceratobasidium sp. 394]